MLKILNNKSFKASIDNFSLVFLLGVYVMTYINKNVYK